MHRVTAIIVNYQTLAYTKKCIEGFRKYYPQVDLILIDNGSQDASTKYIRELSEKDPHTRSILNKKNRTHGPALRQGMRMAQAPYVFILDSDCDVERGRFLIAMLRMFEKDSRLYAVGHRDLVNAAGTAVKGVDRSSFIQYVHPFAMMVDRKKYLQLPPFGYHGSPAVVNMRAVPRHDWKLADFPIATYIHHRRGKTREKFAGRWDPAYPHAREFAPAFKLARGDEMTPILVPTYNAVTHLRRCVRALVRATRVPYRLYIADAGSSSEALHRYLDELERADSATILRSGTRKDFPTINNWAMKQIPASDSVCLLNSDTEPTKGWLTCMLQELKADPQVAIVGARLLYPAYKKGRGGTIQHAGVVLDGKHRPCHVYKHKPAKYPPANVRRELNAVTGACMLIRRAVWDQLQGLDEGFVGGLFEDVDFCWRARKAGWKVLYQPKATVYHFEHGSTSQRQTQAGPNRRRLQAKGYPPKLS